MAVAPTASSCGQVEKKVVKTCAGIYTSVKNSLYGVKTHAAQNVY